MAKKKASGRPSGDGDCMWVAANAAAFFDQMGEADTALIKALRGAGATKESVRLVHAYCTGRGPIDGFRYSHAWVENGDTVFDYANGRKVEMPRDVYYALGGVKKRDASQYRVYTQDEARKKMHTTRVYGPWDLDPAKEKHYHGASYEENAFDDAVRIFPSTRGKIGKRGVHITNDELAALNNNNKME